MRWEIKEGENYRRDAEMLLKATGKLPKAWQNRPVIDSHYDWIMTAFFDLTTCRDVGGFGIGPIPWTAILVYVQYHDLEEDEFYFLKHCLSRMDAEYITMVCPSDKKGKK